MVRYYDTMGVFECGEWPYSSPRDLTGQVSERKKSDGSVSLEVGQNYSELSAVDV